MTDPRLVDRPDALSPVLAAVEAAAVLAIDTEFLWERTYHPTLALVQVAARDAEGRVQAFAVDPLRVDLAPLERLLARPERTKVVHAGRIDLEVFHQRLGAPMPGPIFDTQRGAALAGFGHQVGYANLVEALTGRRLPKTEQYSDWTRRPLRPEQVSYALDDVVPLLDVFDLLEDRLRKAGRLAWAHEEMASLTDPETYVRPSDEDLWRRVKNRRGLDRRALGVLRELALWRERASRERDLRPGFVVKDPILVELARRAPTSRAQLEHVRGLHPAEARKSGEAILAAVQRGLDLPDDALPPADRRPAGPDPGPAVELMRAYVAARAAQVEVAPETLATTADLERLARAHLRGEELEPEDDEEGHDVLRGWRGDLVGKDLVRLLRGEMSLRIDPQKGSLEVE